MEKNPETGWFTTLLKKLPVMSIRSVLLMAFLCAGLVPAALVTGLAFFEARDTLRQEIERDMQVRAAGVAEDIDHLLFERMQSILSWSQLEIMQEVRIKDVDKRLSNFLANIKTSYRDSYVDLFVLDPAGEIVASSDPVAKGRIAQQTAWLTTVLPQGSVRLLSLKGNVLLLAATIDDSFQKQAAGTLVVAFGWQHIRHQLEAEASDGRVAVLLDAQQRALAEVGSWRAVAGKPHLVAGSNNFENLASFGWQVVLAQPEDLAFAPVRHMGWTFILILVLTAVTAVGAAAPVARRMAAPLTQVTYFARNFMREQRVLEPPVGGPMEVRELSMAFHQMIADLEKSRENLTRAAKLAVVGEMAAAMTHEVRTPLGILRSSAQVLLREPGLSPEGREVCGFIVSETERLNRLVSTLLDSARPRPAEMQPVDLTELCTQAVAMLTTQARKHGIELTLQAHDAAVIANCDREQITQVLLNLILNGIQILGAGGRIQVCVRQQGQHAVLEVADDGPGIPPELAERVFDPFFTQRSGGVGLGLAVVRQIVLAHQGEIGVHPSAMGGALFRVRLPLKELMSND